MKDTLILKDGTIIKLEAVSELANLKVQFADRGAMLAVWEQLTDENLAEVQVKNANGLTVGSYSNLVLVSETSTVSADGMVQTSFKLRQKTENELELEEIKETLAVHDEAIGDLAEATSNIAEAVEGGDA